MARQRVDTEDSQATATPVIAQSVAAAIGGASGAPVEEDPNRPPLVQGDGRVVASAVDKAALAAEPKPKRYRVLNDRPIVGSGGHRTMLRAGKVISELHYDIPKLKGMGVQLQPIAPDELA